LEFTYQSNSASQNQKKAKKRVRFIIYILIVIFISWATYEVVSQHGYIQEKRETIKQLETELMEVQTTNNLSAKEIERLQDQEYVEQKIRKEINYTKPGETIFYVPRSTE
jgi:cell division protein DivIC